MDLYELINPSDPITFEASSPAVAGVVGLVLGGGKTSVVGENGETALPFMLFGGDKALDAWAKSVGLEGIESMEAFIDNHRAEIVAALRSTAVCSVSDRKAMAAAVGSDAGAIDRWNDVKRSSMNDFCGYARQVADALEAKGRERG